LLFACQEPVEDAADLVVELHVEAADGAVDAAEPLLEAREGAAQGSRRCLALEEVGLKGPGPRLVLGNLNAVAVAHAEKLQRLDPVPLYRLGSVLALGQVAEHLEEAVAELVEDGRTVRTGVEQDAEDPGARLVREE